MWSFTSREGPEIPPLPNDSTGYYRKTRRHHFNYLNYGGSQFQVQPIEYDYEQLIKRPVWPIGGAANYQGSTFQLWSDGIPTDYILHYDDKPTEWPLSEVLPQPTTSRFSGKWRQYGRDLKHYSITHRDHPRLKGMFSNRVKNLAYYHIDQPSKYLPGTTPRGEAMDPVQALTLKGDSPKDRLFTIGESKLATKLESNAYNLITQ